MNFLQAVKGNIPPSKLEASKPNPGPNVVRTKVPPPHIASTQSNASRTPAPSAINRPVAGPFPHGISVSNVRSNQLRPKYRNLREWMADDANFYVGRAGQTMIDGRPFHYPGSVWSNPFKIGPDGDRADVIVKFRQYILEQHRLGRTDFSVLRNKNLGCWCVPSTCNSVAEGEELVCHGQVLAQLCGQL